MTLCSTSRASRRFLCRGNSPPEEWLIEAPPPSPHPPLQNSWNLPSLALLYNNNGSASLTSGLLHLSATRSTTIPGRWTTNSPLTVSSLLLLSHDEKKPGARRHTHINIYIYMVHPTSNNPGILSKSLSPVSGGVSHGNVDVRA